MKEVKQIEDNKPLSMVMIDSKKELFSLVEDLMKKHRLSFFLLEFLIAELHNEVNIKKEIEIINERKIYEESIEEEK